MKKLLLLCDCCVCANLAKKYCDQKTEIFFTLLLFSTFMYNIQDGKSYYEYM